MGTLICPLCCGEVFSNQESLKYHLLSVTDNLYCPDCGKRFDTIPLLAKHLNGFCGKGNDCEEEEMDTKEDIIATLQQADGSHIVIVQDENNQLNPLSLEEENEPGKEKSESIKLNYGIEFIEPMGGSSANSILPHSPDITLTVGIQNNNKNKINDDDDDDDVELLNGDSEAIELKIPENPSEMDQAFTDNCEQFSCSTCDMTFTSVMEHIETYHDGQQVIIEIPEGDNNKNTCAGGDSGPNGVTIVAKCEDSPMIEMVDTLEGEEEEEDTSKIQEYLESEGLVEFKDKEDDYEVEKNEEEKEKPARNADIIGTLKHEQCFDQKGMRYVRKVVQIEKFWEKDKPNKINSKPPNHVKLQMGKRKGKDRYIHEGLIKIIGGPEAATDDATIERLFLEALEANPTLIDSEECPIEVRYLIDQDGSPKIPIYVCKLCRSEHSSIPKYLKHACKGEGLYCDECGVFFNSMRAMRALRAHKAKFHADKTEKKLYVKKVLEEPVICEFCDTPFWTLRSLKMHKRMHLPPTGDTGRSSKGTDSVSYICTICNTLCKTKRTLAQHQRIHEKNLTEIEKPELLEEAGISLLSSSVAVCKICADSFDTDEKLADHWNECHADMTDSDIGDPTKFVCQVCGEKVYRQFQEIHMAQHCTIMKFNCEICNRSFNTLKLLDLHKRIHLDDKPFTCAVCKEQFLDVESLRDHMQHHSNERPYACSYCGRRFTRPHEKVKHERIHTGEKPHVCSVCGMRFRVNYCLTLHMRTHTGVRPYQCDHCGKRFRAHNGYSQHIKIHSDERAFKCPYCPKTFKTVVQLAGHKNSHTKPYSCAECNRPFASLYSMRIHMESHGGHGKDALKFSCEICGASYARCFALKDHMKSVHGKNYIPTNSDTRTSNDQEDTESD